MATSPAITPPPGYTLETPQSAAPPAPAAVPQQTEPSTIEGSPPPGYTLESNSPGLVNQRPTGAHQPTELEKFRANRDASEGAIQSGLDLLKGTAVGAAKEGVGMVKGAVTNPFPRATDLYDQTFHELPAIFRAYEKARQAGGSFKDALSAANDAAKQQEEARSLFKQRAKEFHDNPAEATGKTLVDLIPLVYGGIKGMAPEAAAETAAETGAEASAETPKPVTAAKEAKVQQSVSKVGLEAGEAGVPEQTIKTPAVKKVTPATEPSQPPQGSMHEPILQNSVRTQVNKLAETEGLEKVPDTVDLRDVGKNISDQLFNRSKAGFAQIKEATGIDVNVIRDQIRDLYSKKAEIFDEPEREGAIIEKINSLESQAEDAMQSAKEKGVNVDQPLKDWRKMNAANDYGEQVRASTDPHQKSGTLDPGKYVPRLEKLYRSKYPNQPGRLQQLVGDTAADTMRDDAYAADQTHQALKNFKPTPGTLERVQITPGSTTKVPAKPPTEGQAVYDMVRQNTGRRFGVLDERTNWVKVYQDFDKLSPAERSARFSDPAQVEQTLLKQARNQRLRTIAGGVAVGALAHEFGVDGYLLKKIAGTE